MLATLLPEYLKVKAWELRNEPAGHVSEKMKGVMPRNVELNHGLMHFLAL
jgi:hypothetical protein